MPEQEPFDPFHDIPEVERPALERESHGDSVLLEWIIERELLLRQVHEKGGLRALREEEQLEAKSHLGAIGFAIIERKRELGIDQ